MVCVKSTAAAQPLAPRIVHTMIGRRDPAKMRYQARLNDIRYYIRRTAQRRLAAATGNPWVSMLWACEEQTGLPRLLFRHGVLVRGWPWDMPFEAPGYIGSLRRLQRIADGLRHGTIWFDVLTPDEVARIEREYGLTNVESRRARRDADAVRFWRPRATRSRRLRKGTVNKTREFVRPEDEIFPDDDIEEWTDVEEGVTRAGEESEIEEFDD